MPRKGCINFQHGWNVCEADIWGRLRNVPKARCSTASTMVESVSVQLRNGLFFFFQIHSFAYYYGNLNMRRLVAMDDIREYCQQLSLFVLKMLPKNRNLNAYFLFAGFFKGGVIQSSVFDCHWRMEIKVNKYYGEGNTLKTD